MAKKNPIIGLGLLVAGGLVANEMLKTPAQETDKTNALGFTGNESETELEAKILSVFKGSKELQRLVKGAQGLTGPTGATGATGATGTPGAQIKPFGGSLVTNSALELNNTEGWTISAGGTLVATDEHDGLLVLSATTTGSGGATNNNKFFIDNRRLLKVMGFAMSGGTTFRFLIRRLNRTNGTVMHSSDINIYGLGNPSFNNTSMQLKTVYFGGIGTTTTSIGLGTAQGMLAVSNDTAGTVQLSHLTVQYVSLGEPVPYTLAFLPVGQVVYDPTTWERGIYNGTSIVWA